MNGAPATMSPDGLSFTMPLSVATGANNVTIAATSTNPPAGHAPQTRTNQYDIQISAATSLTYSYDANGSTTGDGVNFTYEWDGF